jgi:hypothetical protein
MLKKRQKKDTINSWIIKNQKGLSAIVSTLIIILLVLVAVGIIWVVVRNLVQEGAEEIDLGRFTLDLEIKRAQIENGDVTVVVVRRNPGQGNYIGMNFVFFDGINSEIIRENTTLQELEERSFTFTLTEISTDSLETISVAPIFELSSGEESVGDVADSFEVTEEMKAGITGGAVENFAALGFEGVGIVEYVGSPDETVLPEFRRAIVDPLDVLPGHNQTFTVHVYSPSLHSIVNVTSVTELDNSTSNLIFLKISEYEESGETIEIWSVTWVVNDVHAITYRTNITAIDSEGNQNSVTLTWTDSCQSLITTHGGPVTISQNCAIGVGDVNGLDGGILTIASGSAITLNTGSILVFNQGQSIIPDGTIYVNIFGDGSIQKGNLYVLDADGDGYGSGTNVYTTGTLRAKDATGTNDCCDTDADAFPGQTIYFDHPRSGGCTANYDYNCVDGNEKRWTLEYGRCDQCVMNSRCTTETDGSSGWQAAVRSCGNSAWYIVDEGRCRYTAQPCWNEECVDEDRTQECR